MATFKDPEIAFPIGEKVAFTYPSNGSRGEGTVIGHVPGGLIVAAKHDPMIVPFNTLILDRPYKKKPAFPDVMPTTDAQMSCWELDDGTFTYGQCILCRRPLHARGIRAATMGYEFLYCGWACRIIDDRPEEKMQQLQREMST